MVEKEPGTGGGRRGKTGSSGVFPKPMGKKIPRAKPPPTVRGARPNRGFRFHPTPALGFEIVEQGQTPEKTGVFQTFQGGGRARWQVLSQGSFGVGGRGQRSIGRSFRFFAAGEPKGLFADWGRGGGSPLLAQTESAPGGFCGQICGLKFPRARPARELLGSAANFGGAPLRKSGAPR